MIGSVAIDLITEFYLGSADYKGIPFTRLQELLELSDSGLRGTLRELIADRKVDLAFASWSENPHIKRLRLGAAQVEPVFFRFEALERYRNDPRYAFEFRDYEGSISIKDEPYEDDNFPNANKVGLQSFGLGYDADNNRAVALFLTDLCGLTPEHQQYWASHELHGDFKVAEAFYRQQVMGEWFDAPSVYRALIEEQVVINQMAAAMGKTPLFRETFEHNGPAEFSLVMLPTRRNFNAFVETLDKMLSENLNRQFFRGDVDLDEEHTRRDGKIEVRPKGTIRLLEEWIRLRFRLREGDPAAEVRQAFDQVREPRSRSAHAIMENEYDARYHKLQDELIQSAYRGVRTIRLILANHPQAKEVEVPDWLYKGEFGLY